ncbi:MAG: hypothetical protein RL660_351 [Bacteroidota bacterium]|jgi:outer membrane receptor protein involved in Fe transport
MLKYCLAVMMVFCLSQAFGQANISGVVMSNGSPNTSASVLLISNDSIFVETLVNKNGAFEINTQRTGKVKVVATISSERGIATVDTTIVISEGDNIKLGTLNLSYKSGRNALEGITAVAAKPVTKVSADKKVYNVGSDVTAAGGAASDLLRNVPGVQIDPVDGTPSIRGNTNIILLIDGRQSVIFGNDIAGALQTIPASSIESIEVINNPGAQFDAQGKAGAINIVLKKDNKLGVNGNLGLNIGFPYRFNATGGANVNIGKVNFFANGSFRNSYTWTNETIERENLLNDTTYTTTSYTTRRPKNGFVNFGLDYSPTKKDKFTISQNFFSGNMAGTIVTSYMPQVNFTQQLSRQYRENEYTGRPNNGTTSFAYTHNFAKKGQDLKVDVSYGNSRYRRTSDFETKFFTANDEWLDTFTRQSIPVDGGNKNITASIDYIHPIKENTKVEVGVKQINFRFRSQNTPIMERKGATTFFDSALWNKFEYTQQTYAAYTNVKHSFGKYSLQAGLRYENFIYDGFVYQYNQDLQATFSNFFPSAYVTRKLSERSELNLSYIKRVNRPNFFQMVPYLDVSNPQDTSQGNPALLPEFIHASELTYTKSFGARNTLLWSAYYQYNDNLIQRYRRFNNNGTTFSQQRNLASGITYGTEFNVKYYIRKNWDAALNVNVFRNQINGNNVDVSVTNIGWGGFAKVISNYKLNNIYDLQLASNYQAPTIIAQGRTRGYWNVDLAAKRQFFKKMMTVTLGANDIFNTIYNQVELDVPNVYTQFNNRKPQTRQVTLGVQLRFANKKGMNMEAPRRTMGRNGMKEENKDAKSRDENLKRDDNNDDGGGREATPQPAGGAPAVPPTPPAKGKNG